MTKLEWCLQKKKGTQLIEQKPHLSKSYMNEADETLENAITATGKWKVITAYYACYNALYSILMRCGIKCEIHECSIELMALFDFTNEDIDYMRKLKEDRIQAQYYLKKIELENEEDIKRFILKCKIILHHLDSERIEQIRQNIKAKRRQ